MTFIYHCWNRILHKKRINDMQREFEADNNKKYKFDSL